MTGDTVECYNCGRANPAWAQVCRSCGVPIRPVTPGAASGPIPTDRDSIVSIVAGVAAIAGAIVLGLVLSGLLPEAAPLATTSATPQPSPTPLPSGSPGPSAAPTGEESAEPTPGLIGRVTFGTGIDQSTRRATGRTDTFTSSSAFCHSVRLSERFGVDAIQEEILRVEDDGSLTEVQGRAGSNLSVNPNVRIAGFCADAGGLIEAWGVGEYVLRDYRGDDPPELIAEGRFNLAR